MQHPDEILDDLQLNGLRILRKARAGEPRPYFAYGSDAVLLSDFVRAKKGDNFLDIGTGTGILALLVHAKTGARFTAVDIQAELADMAARSVELNGLTDEIQVFAADARLLHESCGYECFDGIVCNPPYHSGGTKSPSPARRMSTHEETLSIEELALCAKRLLKNGGKLFVCYPAAGLARLFTALSQNGIIPKRMKAVSAVADGTPYLVLTEAVKGAKHGLVWEK